MGDGHDAGPGCLVPPGAVCSADHDEIKSQNSQNSQNSASQQSSQSNNSRAHMYKVSQINFVKKQAGKFNDNYSVEEQLGQGSFGKVCRCINKISKFERAVKFIKKTSIDDPKEV